MQIYGTKQAPIYNLTKIDFPVHLFVGEYDRLADVKDADRLFKELGSSNKVFNLLFRNLLYLNSDMPHLFGVRTQIMYKNLSKLFNQLDFCI